MQDNEKRGMGYTVTGDTGGANTTRAQAHMYVFYLSLFPFPNFILFLHNWDEQAMAGGTEMESTPASNSTEVSELTTIH